MTGRVLRLWGYLLLWIAMMAIHQDFWNWNDATLVLGILPMGLAYQAGYSLLAAAIMWVLVRLDWPAHLERLETEHEPRR